jgi:Flp pilus assembly protein TadB
MALSDYERRVLDEIEAALQIRPPRRWRLRRAVALVVLCALLAVGLIVLAVLALPPAFVAVTAGVLGAAVGCVAGLTWRRQHWR